MTVYQTDAAGFFVGEVTPRVLRGQPLIPAGCVETAPPDIPEGKLARWTGAEWDLIDTPGPAPEADPEPETEEWTLQQERDRRLAMGFSFDFGDERGVHIIGTTADDMRGWDEVTQFCDLVRRGVIDQPSIGISTETGDVEITPAEWDLILAAAAAFRQPVWQASFALANLDELPTDFADDAWWT